MSVFSVAARTLGALGFALYAQAALAQRADDNAVTEAEDAFGTTVGNENLGLYSPFDARGFSPIDAGNGRIDGLYFDQQADPPGTHISDGSTIRIGIAAQGFPLPAPTGIADYSIKRPGSKSLFSVYAQLGPYLDQNLELDYQTPLTSTLGVTGGVSIGNFDVGAGGPKQVFATAGLAAAWKPSSVVEIRPFVERSRNWDREAQPIIFTAGAFLPPRINRRRFYGQNWTDSAGLGGNTGVLGRVNLGQASLRLGVFHSFFERKRGFVDLFLNTDQQGLADHVIIADPNQRFASMSGEARFAYTFGREGGRHTLYLIARGRDQRRRYGGSDVRTFGKATIGMPAPLPEFEPVFGAQSKDRVRQFTLAAAYEGQPVRWLALSGGVQKARYRKETTDPGSSDPISGRDDPWLYNIAAAVRASSKLAIYASYTSGLEEGGVAPDSAVNKGSAAPAIVTKQIDAGIRYAIKPDLKLIVGAFQVEKPYYNLDGLNLYRRLGEVRQRGIEMSLAGQLFKDFRIVAGTVLLDPRVLGEEVASGLIGFRPVGQVRRLTIASADYTIAAVKGLSVNTTLTSVSARTANSANTLAIPARSVVDVGARYRFKIGSADASLIGRVGNVLDKFGFRTNASGLFVPNDPRRFSIALAADF